MYEFFLAFKYLIPKKKNLSTAIISILSILVISLVVWLTIVFLSVISAIEKTWEKKLTTINADIKITPTKNYFSSYYYLIDKMSKKSNFTFKTINEKLKSNISNPYLKNLDMELPSSFPLPAYDEDKNSALDPVKEAFLALEKKKKEYFLSFEDYEISGALANIFLKREGFLYLEKSSSLKQLSYILSHCKKNTKFSTILEKPTLEDLNNLLFSLKSSSKLDEKKVFRFFKNVEIKKVKTDKNFKIFENFEGLKDFECRAKAFFQKGKILKIFLVEDVNKNQIQKREEILQGRKKRAKTEKNPSYEINSSKNNKIPPPHLPNKESLSRDKENFSKNEINLKKINRPFFIEGTLCYKNQKFIFEKENFFKKEVQKDKIHLQKEKIFNVELIKESLTNAKNLKDVNFTLNLKIGNKKVFFKRDLSKYIKISKANIFNSFTEKPKSKPFWAYTVKEKTYLPKKKSVLLPKSLKKTGVLIGDKGDFTYSSLSFSSLQQQQIPFKVAGFYDPGVLPIGNRFIIADKKITSNLISSNETLNPDISTNGILIWTKNKKNIDKIKKELKQEFINRKISPFWKIETYKEYEFSKDLIEQFQSDKMLFTLISVIILIVASCNIISLLILLVNNKKKDIATLQALGAKKKNIAIIFSSCGIIIGIIGSILGTFFAIITLKNLDILVNFLSYIQGHNAFNPSFFGDKLPNDLSKSAITFVLISTPIISLIAGLVSAIKACKINPSKILREL